MAEGFAACWREDLERALALGRGRDPTIAPGSATALLIWAALCALAAAGLYLGGGYHAGFGALNALGSARPQWPWQLVTLLGDERLLFALALLVARRHPRALWALVLGGLIGAAFTHGLKPLVMAARPPAVLPHEALSLIGAGYRKGSFPSGHSLAIALFLGVWLGLARGRWLRLGLMVLAVEIACSRVVVGVHWPVDVAVGLMGGVLSAWAGLRLAGRWDWGVRLPGHALLVLLSLGFALRVLGSRGDYPAGTWLMDAAALAGVGRVLWDYGIGPWRGWRDSRARREARSPRSSGA